MSEGEKIAALLRVQEFPEEDGKRFIVMGTRKGTIKKTDLTAFSNPRSAGIIAIQIDDDDRLIAVAETDGTKDLVIGSQQRHGDPVRGVRRAADGPHAPTASAACSCARATRSSRCRW